MFTKPIIRSIKTHNNESNEVNDLETYVKSKINVLNSNEVYSNNDDNSYYN